MFAVIICAAILVREPYNVCKIFIRGRTLFFIYLLFTIEVPYRHLSCKFNSSFQAA